MATPKKKHLIELMIETGVKWPDGAEYAAQDKYDLNVNFYKNGKPNFQSGYLQWLANDCTFMSDYGIELDSLCRNWNQTIVTREQYAEAVAAADNGSTTNQVRESEDVPASQPAAQLYSGVAGVMPSESIESLLAEIKAKRGEHDELVASAESLALQISEIEQQVNDKLKEYGFAMSHVAAPSEPKQLVITDWRDLRVGDVVEYVHGTASSREGKQGEICEIDENDQHNRIQVMFGENEYERFWCSNWRFIRRP